MGHKLAKTASVPADNILPWLDSATAALVTDIIQTLREYRPDLLAVILYGSVARHAERPVTDPSPSDVDLLAIFDTDDERIALHEGAALFDILGMAYDRHLDALRDVKVMFASRTLGEWDGTFIASVARDGLLLWARSSLPDRVDDDLDKFFRSFGATEEEIRDSEAIFQAREQARQAAQEATGDAHL
jgi:predicted nucleotidyltransferase